MAETQNLMDGILSEMNRAREILAMYEEIPQGAFGAAMIKMSVARAEKAISSGDIVEILKCYNDLKEIE